MKFIFNNKEYPSIDGVKKAYYGGQGPVPPGPDYTEPFYIQDLSGSENTVQITKQSSSTPTITIEKSIDGKNWTVLGTTSTTAITTTIPANEKLYLRCNAVSWNGNYIKATGSHKVGGNIMSLLYGTNFTGDETVFPSGSSRTFNELFQVDTYLMDASELLLQATTLTEYCYYNMFRSCTGLTTAPVLPAATLAGSCYYSMFYGCTGLTTAPVLPATTLVNECYRYMFYGCTSLNSVKCLATDISAYKCLKDWMFNVSSDGTFVKKAGVTWPSGVNGIPNGWTVVEV